LKKNAKNVFSNYGSVRKVGGMSLINSAVLLC